MPMPMMYILVEASLQTMAQGHPTGTRSASPLSELHGVATTLSLVLTPAPDTR